MIGRMLSVASLTAFVSGGVGPVQPTPVRVPDSAPPAASPPQLKGPPAGKGEGATEPTRMLPRGSLLDLSV
jgi:hypothetical protein